MGGERYLASWERQATDLVKDQIIKKYKIYTIVNLLANLENGNSLEKWEYCWRVCVFFSAEPKKPVATSQSLGSSEDDKSEQLIFPHL